MELKKYKVCPSCGERNAPSKIECRNCEADLTGVKVVDETTEKAPSDPAPVVPEKGDHTSTLVRICDCGAQNPPQARKCSVCGEDISDIRPSPAPVEEQKTLQYELRSIDSAFSVLIDKPTIVIGRQAELSDYLCTKNYVSRTHAKLTIVAEKVFIENVSSTNRTFVNNELLPDATPTPLNNGDEIGLGGKVISGERQENAAYLIFSVKS